MKRNRHICLIWCTSNICSTLAVNFGTICNLSNGTEPTLLDLDILQAKKLNQPKKNQKKKIYLVFDDGFDLDLLSFVNDRLLRAARGDLVLLKKQCNEKNEKPQTSTGAEISLWEKLVACENDNEQAMIFVS